MNNGYYKTRYCFSLGRSKVWKAICEYIQQYIKDPVNSIVLDLGCGYCDFINNIKASQKIALDISSESQFYASDDVVFHNSSVTNINVLEDCSVDVIFASNLFEHLDDNELLLSITEVLRILKSGGRLIVLQPNFKYSFREYFDDYTHKKIFTHVSFSDLLRSHGFNVIRMYPRFLPMTLKSGLPKSYWLTKLYLNMPFKPLAKQMLLVFEKAF